MADYAKSTIKVELGHYTSSNGGWGLTIYDDDDRVLIEGDISDDDLGRLLAGRTIKVEAERLDEIASR